MNVDNKIIRQILGKYAEVARIVKVEVTPADLIGAIDALWLIMSTTTKVRYGAPYIANHLDHLASGGANVINDGDETILASEVFGDACDLRVSLPGILDAARWAMLDNLGDMPEGEVRELWHEARKLCLESAPLLCLDKVLVEVYVINASGEIRKDVWSDSGILT